MVALSLGQLTNTMSGCEPDCASWHAEHRQQGALLTSEQTNAFAKSCAASCFLSPLGPSNIYVLAFEFSLTLFINVVISFS